MFGIPYTRQDWIDREVAQTVTWDLRGYRFHIFFGLMWCGLVAGPISWVEFAGVGLVITCVARAWYIHRTWRSFGCHPQLWALAIWAGWQWWSVSWSPDPKHGLWELGSNRWTWSLWFLWTLLPRRSWLITAVIISFFCANLGQLVQAVGIHIPAIEFPKAPDRNAAWWQPVVGGSMLCSALGLHLPAAAMGTGQQRWFGIAGSAVTLMGIFATGTRGAWIGAALLVAIVLAVAVVRWTLQGEGRSGKRIGLLVGALVVTMGVAWLLAGDGIMRRYRLGRAEVARAIDKHDYASDTGARILMWQWAIEAIKTHPVRGIGAGGFNAWVVAEMRKQGQEKDIGHIHRHAHSTYLHIAATTGLVGLCLWCTAIGMGIWGGFRGMKDRLGTYAAGPAFAVVGLLLAGMFDVIQLNVQTSALLALLMSLTIWPRPREWSQSPEIDCGPPLPATRSM